MVRVIVVILLVETAGHALQGECDPLKKRCSGIADRAEIADHLEHTQGKHLVMVQYNRFHNIHVEWVYNGAEIDSAKILWARDIDAEQNENLFAYFKDRRIWLVKPDEHEEKARQLTPYLRLADQTQP